MNIQLIKGEFETKEALNLISEMIQIKIKYHENKISLNNNEEDIKHRESKIKNLQNQLSELRNDTNMDILKVKIDAIIKIE